MLVKYVMYNKKSYNENHLQYVKQKVASSALICLHVCVLSNNII